MSVEDAYFCSEGKHVKMMIT